MFRWLRGSVRAEANPRWLEGASPRDRCEYDAFGPWVREVTSPGELPPIFDPWYAGLAGAEYLLKVPVDIERRLARPGQNLYRTVLAVRGDRIHQLSQQDGAVSEETIAFTDIRAIRSYRCLLQGELRLLLAGGREFLFAYNAVSQELVERVIDFILARLDTGSVGDADGTAADIGTAPLTEYYHQVVRAAVGRRDPAMRLVHAEMGGGRCRDSRGRMRRRLGLLVFDNGRCWLFADRSQPCRKAGSAVYATAYAWIPRTALRRRALAAVSDRHAEAGQRLTLDLAGHEPAWILYGDPAGLCACLDAQAGLESRPHP
jgi:hypothetical protein